MAGKKDERIDAYISNAQPFAQPVLKHLRKLIHKAIPDVEENIKWGFASFDYKGPLDRKSTRLNSSHVSESRMPSSA